MLTRARLVLRDAAPDEAAALQLLSSLIAVFPSLEVGIASERATSHGLAAVDAGAWRAVHCDVSAFDGRMTVFESSDGPLDISGTADDVGAVAVEVLTRYQRYIVRRNLESRSTVFTRLAALHREREARELEHRRGRYGRSRDVLHWALRVEPFASLPLQAAALFLDVARLEAHALVDDERRSVSAAQALDEIFEAARIETWVREEAVALVAGLERLESGDDGLSVIAGSELAILRDADALSFFSSSVDDVADRTGARAKIRAQLARLSAPAWSAFASIRLRSDVASMVARERRSLRCSKRKHEVEELRSARDAALFVDA